MMRDVVIDIDGVLGDFEGEFCKKFGYENRHMVSLEDRYPKRFDEIDLFVNFSSVYERLDILPTGYQIAKWCDTQGLDIHIVSSRPDYITQTTAKWLKRNGIPFKYLSVAQTRKIDRIININPLFVVEDIRATCLKCAEYYIPAFLIDHPWNQGKLPNLVQRIQNFGEFQQKVADFTRILENYDDNRLNTTRSVQGHQTDGR